MGPIARGRASGAWSGLGYFRQPSIGRRAREKQSSPNGLFNERQCLSGLAGFDLGGLGAKLHGDKLVFLGLKTCSGLLKSSGGAPQLVFGIYDHRTVRTLCRFSPHLGATHSFYCTVAERLGAGFGLARMLFHVPENISCLVDQIKGRGTPVGGRRLFKPALRHTIQARCGTLQGSSWVFMVNG